MLLHKKRLYAPDEDRKEYHFFVEVGVIVPRKHEMVEGQQICTICADGFRPHMKEAQLRSCKRKGKDNTFHHTPAGNGDAMRFAYRSPLNDDGSDDWGRLKTLELAETLGWAAALGIPLFQHRMGHHWPCKAGTSRNITFGRSIDLVVRGKTRIKHQLQELKVAMDLFGDWGKNDFTFDLIKKEKYMELIETDPRLHQTHEEWLAYKEIVSTLPVLEIAHH